MRYENVIHLNEREISAASSVCFIADLAANHDGDIQRAKDLIWLAKEAGADVVKLQHHKAENIVSDLGFKKMGGNIAHQSSWKKSVFEIHKQYECDRNWTEDLVQTAKEAEIDLFTTPYDYEAVDLLDHYLPAYKIGSGDITWIDFIEKIAKKNKPVFIATGASTLEEVDRAVEAVLKHNKQIILMQCNTNYTGSRDNFKYVNLNVLKTFATKYPEMILGFSDHTPGHSAVLGAIALGAKVIEKHFTDDNDRKGPDHVFSLNPMTWKEMVDRSSELELALGDGVKCLEKNEEQAVIVQRRSLYFTRDIKAGDKIQKEDVKCLRPAPENSIKPYEIDGFIGKALNVNKKDGEPFSFEDIS